MRRALLLNGLVPFACGYLVTALALRLRRVR